MLVRTQDRSLVTKPAACRRTIEARSPSRWRRTSGLLRGALTLANRPTSSELELERVAERRPDLRCAYSLLSGNEQRHQAGCTTPRVDCIAGSGSPVARRNIKIVQRFRACRITVGRF